MHRVRLVAVGWCLLCAWTCLLAAAPAAAAPPEDLASVTSPRAAYERGTEQWQSGDKSEAAHWYARADEIQPNDRVLGAALNAAIITDQPALALALAARAERPGTSNETQKLAREARTKFSKRVGKISIRCGDPSSCAAEIDGKPPPEAGFVAVGAYRVSWACPGGRQEQNIAVEASAERIVEATCAAPKPEAPAKIALPPSAEPSPTPPLQPASPPGERRGGVDRAWFWVGLGATAVLGGFATWSYLDTRSKHDEFVASGKRDEAVQREGKSAETRTYILLGATALVAVGTGALGVLAVDWKPGRVDAATVPSENGAFVAVGVKGW